MRFALAAVLVAAASGCAYVGDPLPPSLKIPAPITDLRAIQRGDKIEVELTPPVLTTDGVTLEPAPLPELLIGFDGETPTQIVTQPIPVEPWAGKQVVLGARTRGPTGRLSDWSNLVTLSVIPPLGKPAALAAIPTAEGITVHWQSSAAAHRVYRNGELAATVEASEFIDRSAAFDVPYEYIVQGVTGQAESEMSDSIRVTRPDVYPPPAPERLTVLAGVTAAEVSWDRSSAPDVAFYRLYRDGTLLADNLTGTLYSDKAAQPGRKYQYAVSAVDHNKNEGVRSAPVEIEIPE